MKILTCFKWGTFVLLLLFDTLLLLLVFTACSMIVSDDHTSVLIGIADMLRNVGLLGVVTGCIRFFTAFLCSVHFFMPLVHNPFWWIVTLILLFSMTVLLVLVFIIRRQFERQE